jgi:hypothetical protein
MSETNKQHLTVESIINKLNEAFLPENLECDGGICVGCWKDVINEAIELIKQYDSKTSPLLEEIAKLKEEKESIEENRNFYQAEIYSLIPNGIKTNEHALNVAKSIINQLEPYLTPNNQQREAVNYLSWFIKKYISDDQQLPEEEYLTRYTEYQKQKGINQPK